MLPANSSSLAAKHDFFPFFFLLLKCRKQSPCVSLPSLPPFFVFTHTCAHGLDCMQMPSPVTSASSDCASVCLMKALTSMFPWHLRFNLPEIRLLCRTSSSGPLFSRVWLWLSSRCKTLPASAPKPCGPQLLGSLPLSPGSPPPLALGLLPGSVPILPIPCLLWLILTRTGSALFYWGPPGPAHMVHTPTGSALPCLLPSPFSTLTLPGPLSTLRFCVPDLLISPFSWTFSSHTFWI